MLFNKLAKQLCFLWVIGLTCLFVQCTPSPVEEIVNSTQSSLLVPTWRPTKTTLPATPTIILPITPTQVAITPFPTLPPTPTLVAPTPTDTMVVTSPTISVTFPPNAKVVIATDFQTDAFHLRLYTLDSAGNLGQQLTGANSQSGDPAWSPDCSQLLFTNGPFDERTNSLSILDINTGSIVVLPTHLQSHFSPNWSPDGKEIVFSGYDGQSFQIYTFSIETQSVSQLTNEGGEVPDWSSDGKEIVFVSFQDAVGIFDFSIYIMSSNGEGQRRLIGPEWGEYTFESPAGFSPHSAAWSPNGELIAFSATYSPDDGLEYQRIYVADKAGDDLRLVTNDQPHNFYEDPLFSESRPNWSPDGLTISFIRGSIYGSSPDQLCFASFDNGEFVCLPNDAGTSFFDFDWCFE